MKIRLWLSVGLVLTGVNVDGLPSASPTSMTTSDGPTAWPTNTPVNLPTASPSMAQTSRPTNTPVNVPTALPSMAPTRMPTKPPTTKPTALPSTAPTSTPTKLPTILPTALPSTAPTRMPTRPTSKPTPKPTPLPSNAPTFWPSSAPTLEPSSEPTATPTPAPTPSPSPIFWGTAAGDGIALCNFFSETALAEVRALTNWCTVSASTGFVESPCDYLFSWRGVTCACESEAKVSCPPPSRRVVAVDLRGLVNSSAPIAATLPSTIGYLGRLESLESGRSVVFSSTLPASLVRLSRLTTLQLGGSRLTGTIATALADLSMLKSLNLSGNSLSGSIPNIWPISLVSLDLGDNSLSGGVPAQLGALTNLQTLMLGQNALTGPFPAFLPSLPRLGTLELGGNKLTGSVPEQLCSTIASSSGSFELTTSPNLFECYPRCLKRFDGPLTNLLGPTCVKRCKAGFYVDIGDFSDKCLKCPIGTSSNAGTAVGPSACVNVITNFVLAMVSAVLATAGGFVYLFMGRYHRVAFVRRERVVLPQLLQFRVLMRALEALQRGLKRQEKVDRARAAPPSRCVRMVKVAVFYLLSLLAVVLVTLASYLLRMVSVLVDVLILFRGLKLNASFLGFLFKLAASLGPVVEFLFVPVRTVIELLARISIDLSAIQVTCPGASAPMNLLLDYWILGALIVIVGSDYQVFRSRTFKVLVERYGTLMLEPMYFKWVTTTDDRLKWSAYKYARFLVYTLLAIVSSQILDFQLVLRFLMAQATFDFSTPVRLATSPTNACDKVKGIEGLDSALAISCLVLAVFTVVPLIYEIGKFIVSGTPTARIDGLVKVLQRSVERAQESDQQASSGIKWVDKRHSQSTDPRPDPAREKEYAKSFQLFDLLFWLPSILAPDLWVAHLSMAFISKLKRAVPLASDKARPLSLGWSVLEASLRVKRPSGSTEDGQDEEGDKATATALVRSSSEEANVAAFMCACVGQGSVFHAVLAPRREFPHHLFDYASERPRFYENPASALYENEDDVIFEEYKRWKYVRRLHSLPTFLELISVYTRCGNAPPVPGSLKSTRLGRPTCAALVRVARNWVYHKAAFLCTFMTQGLVCHLAHFLGIAVWRQILSNFFVFTHSCLGIWTPWTQDAYGVAEMVRIMNINLGAGTEKLAVEHWISYSETWAAIIGPRAILWQTVPQLTPLMTWTKIMATSPLLVLDSKLEVPDLFDVDQFFRKSRRDNAGLLEQEWIVFMDAICSYLLLSRLAQLVINLCTVVLVFLLAGLAGSHTGGGVVAQGRATGGEGSSSPPSQTLKYALVASLVLFGWLGVVSALRVVMLLGQSLEIRDSDLPWTAGLQQKIDDVCAGRRSAWSFALCGCGTEADARGEVHTPGAARAHQIQLTEVNPMGPGFPRRPGGPATHQSVGSDGQAAPPFRDHIPDRRREPSVQVRLSLSKFLKTLSGGGSSSSSSSSGGNSSGGNSTQPQSLTVQRRPTYVQALDGGALYATSRGGMHAHQHHQLEPGAARRLPTAHVAAELAQPTARSAWLYIDLAGQVQGPFDRASMLAWHAGGSFPPSLRVKEVRWRGFHCLSSLFLDQSTAFTHVPTEPEVQWGYRDDAGRIQGPFDTGSMRGWAKGGYLLPSRHIKVLGEWTAMHPMGLVYPDLAMAFVLVPEEPVAEVPAKVKTDAHVEAVAEVLAEAKANVDVEPGGEVGAKAAADGAVEAAKCEL